MPLIKAYELCRVFFAFTRASSFVIMASFFSTYRVNVPPLPPRHQHASMQATDVLTSVTDPHVRQLVNEGFDEHSATRALHLSKDNVQLARDILIEFGRR